jgi:hypothetical protein
MLWLAQRFPKEGEAVPIVPDIENPKLAQMLQKNRVDPELQVKFDIGHISHDLLQNQYLGPAGLLWGSWACSACGVIGAVDTTYPQMPHCQVAATNAGADKIEKKVGPAAVGDQNREAVLPWRYVEPPIRVATGGFVISGYCDGIIMLNGVKSVVEAKTINSRGFSALKEPHEDHVYQLQLYLAALRMEKGYVLYLDKDTQKMKEFEVIRDDSVLPKIIAKIQLALAVQRGQVATAPDRVCASPGETRAKYACPWAEMCFDSLASAWTVEGKPL